MAELRQARGETQQELADALGMSPQYLRRVEAGTVNLTLRSIARFAEALGVTEHALLEVPTTKRAGRGRPVKSGKRP